MTDSLFGERYSHSACLHRSNDTSVHPSAGTFHTQIVRRKGCRKDDLRIYKIIGHDGTTNHTLGTNLQTLTDINAEVSDRASILPLHHTVDM
jgi:hypothetical protein